MFSFFRRRQKQELQSVESLITEVLPIIKVGVDSNSTDPFEVTDNGPVYKRICGDLICFFGIDRGAYFELILRTHLPDRISIDDLEKTARENLVRKIEGNTKIHQTTFGGIGFSCGGEFEASLLIVPDIWEAVVERLGSPLFFAVPSKELIAFVSSKNDTSLNGLRDMVMQVHNREEKPLSKHIFLYEDGKMSVAE